MNTRAVLTVVFLGIFLPTSNTSAEDIVGSKLDCVEQKAGESDFTCLNTALMSKIDLNDKGLSARSGNDIWGWTDPVTGREFAIMGMNSKTSFVDVSDPVNPVHIGDLKTHTFSSSWRDMKVYNDHAFIVSEAFNHGLQVFDLKQLRELSGKSLPITYNESAFYGEFGSAHNIFIHEDVGMAYVVGSNTCDQGMHVVDVRKPLDPTFVTCIDRDIFDPPEESSGEALSSSILNSFDLFSLSSPPFFHGEDYTHDVQCVIYEGPDANYLEREICIASNADSINIVDMTDKANPVQVSVIDYPGLGYTHQGWLSEDQHYFFLGDELDESRFDHKTKTLVFDMSSLDNPTPHFNYEAETFAIDHNMYVRGDFLFQANYDAGLRILDISRVAEKVIREVAFFDILPNSDRASFRGAWSVYPFFKSGNIILSAIEGDLFVLQPSLK